MIEYINDAREEDILDRAYEHLAYGGYGSGVQSALSRTEHYMNKGRAEGTFLYDEVTGKRLSGIHNALTGSEMLLAGIAGIAVALVVYMSIRGSYNLAGTTYSYHVNDNASVTLTQDEESYLRQYVTRTARSSSSGSGGSSGGSGVHRSSSGRSHGGGGRRF